MRYAFVAVAVALLEEVCHSGGGFENSYMLKLQTVSQITSF